MTIVLVGIKRIAIALDIGLDVFQLVHRGKEIVLEHKQIVGVTDVSDIVGYMYLAPSAALRHCFCLPYGYVDGPTMSIYCDCRIKCVNLGFRQGTSACVNNNNIIPLSTLVSDTDTNVADVEYGQGATLSQCRTWWRWKQTLLLWW